MGNQHSVKPHPSKVSSSSPGAPVRLVHYPQQYYSIGEEIRPSTENSLLEINETTEQTVIRNNESTIDLRPGRTQRPVLLIDANATILISEPTCEYRRPRNPRETADLYVYCSYRNWEAAKRQICLNRGLDYISTNRRFSVLHVAVENNAPVEVVKLMLEQGVDPNVRDTLFNQTPLHVMMKVMDEDDTFELLKLLVGCGADVNAEAKVCSTCRD
jgi:hypothetical protein